MSLSVPLTCGFTKPCDGLRIVLRNATSIPIHTQIVLGGRVFLVSGFAEPSNSSRIILRNTAAIPVCQAETVLGVSFAELSLGERIKDHPGKQP